MNIDLTNFVANNIERLEVEGKVEFSEKYFCDTSIRNLIDPKFVGVVTKLCDDTYQLSGVLSGIMILPDDITLEDVRFSFTSQIEEKFGENFDFVENNLKIVQNKLDITEFLWQNILVEIPTKVVSEKNKDLTLKGNGWRLVTEEELKNSNNSPFNELSKMFDSRKE